MTFLYPAFLLGALAIALPIVLHLLRRDVAPPVPFTAVRLLRRTPLEQTRRRRLRELLLLAARVAALLLLAAAFARPYFAGAAGDDRLHVVAIDRSYSMSGPRFERALALAREAIDAVPRGARVAVLGFDDRADVVAAPGGAGEARSALPTLRPGSGGTRFAPVIARAVELAGAAPAHLVVISDMQQAGWGNDEPLAVPAALEIELRDVEGPAANAAVVDVRLEPRHVVATLRHDGAPRNTGTARLRVDGREVASAPYAVSQPGAVEVRIPYQAPDRGALAVAIDDPDGYAADNIRYLLLDPRGRTQVLVVSTDDPQSGFYLTRALQTMSGDNAMEVRTTAAKRLGAMTAAQLAPTGAIVLLSTRNLDRRGRDLLSAFVAGGGGLLVAAAPDVDPSSLAAMLNWTGFAAAEQGAGGVAFAATDLRHPILRPFGPLAVNLGQIRFTRAWHVRAEGWEVAARFTDGAPALLERRGGRGRVVLFASDLDRRWNDFPLHPGFVPFAVETIRYVANRSDGRRDYVVADAPRGAGPEPGVYDLEAGRRVAVNVDARESALARMSAEEFRSMVRSVDRGPVAAAERRAEQIEGRQNLWRYGLMLMLGALIAESVVGRK